MKHILGIDVGGTSIKGAIVNERGEVVTDSFSLPIIKTDNQFEIIDKLIAIIKDFLKMNNAKIDGIGMGIPGSINSEDGIVTYSNNLRWFDLPIVDLLKKEFNVPVKITNDANAAALGENRFGAGKEFSEMIMITLGTGVGGGIIIHNGLYEGNLGKGAELGHITLVMDGLQCSCGRKGCYEMYASASALIRQTKEAMQKHPESLLNEVAIESVNGKTVFDYAKLGDKTANEVLDQYVRYLGEGLINYCNIFRPQCIVLSGGIAKQKEYLLDRLIPFMEKEHYGYPCGPKVVIKTAVLGYDAGIIGAASLLISQN